MAPNPIACANRIVVNYVVNGLAHAMRLFVLASASGGSYDLVHQLSGNQPWKDDIEHALTLIVPMYHTGVTFGDCVLEQYAFGAYFPLEFYTPTANAGTSSQASNLAGQLTWTFRDTVLRKAKILMMESILESDEHITSLSAQGGVQGPFVDDIFTPSGDNDMGFWLRSRSEDFIQSYVAMTTTDNDKLRRARNFL